MAKFIQIKDGALSAKIAPANGGMVAQITIGDTDVLMFREDAIELIPMGAGGLPVMFPFPSKTKDDTYWVDGQEYTMPMLGLVKNGTFAVKSQSANTLTLWCDSSASQQTANYPFDYLLEIEYKLSNSTLSITARVTNRSNQPMPHYLGWHPYFKTTNKAALTLEHSMTCHYDYVNGKDEATIQELDLSKHWDDVFHTPAEKAFTLTNPADGYRVRCRPDEVHNVLIVFSGEEGAVCLEPLCGLPDSINHGRFVKNVQPGKTECYQVVFEFEKL